MTATVDRTALANALAAVKHAVEARCTIPILANVALAGDADALTVEATNMDMRIRARVPARGGDAVATTVPHAILDKAVAKSKADAVTLTQIGPRVREKASQECALVTKLGRTTVRLNALPIEDVVLVPEMGPNGPSATKKIEKVERVWPDFAPVTDKRLAAAPTFTMSGAELFRCLDKVAFAVSTEETRYYLNGVFLGPVKRGPRGPKHLEFVATDGHRLALAEADLPKGAAKLVPGIIPAWTVKTVLKLLRKTKTGTLPDTVKITMSDTAVEFAFDSWAGEVEVTSKLIDGTFPDYQRVIPTANPHTATISSIDLAEALDAVSVVKGGGREAISLAPGAGMLTLRMEDKENGSAAHEINAAINGEAPTIGFNARYLGEIMKTLAADTLTLQLADAGAPAIIRGDADPRLLTVLMPMRLNVG